MSVFTWLVKSLILYLTNFINIYPVYPAKSLETEELHKLPITLKEMFLTDHIKSLVLKLQAVYIYPRIYIKGIRKYHNLWPKETTRCAKDIFWNGTLNLNKKTNIIFIYSIKKNTFKVFIIFVAWNTNSDMSDPCILNRFIYMFHTPKI